jgi:hypothetical protein
MITLILLAILGLMLVLILRAMFRAPASKKLPHSAAPTQIPAANSDDVDPWDAQKSDVISISGAATDFSDLDFAVDRRSAYQGSAHRWIDLSGEFRGERVHLEVQRYPEPDLMGILDARKVTLADIGTTEDLLADMDARQDPSASIEFEDKKWHWESSREIRYFENETGDGEGLYRWIFRESDGARLICIDKWEGEPFEVHVARRLNQRDVTVYPTSPGAVA